MQFALLGDDPAALAVARAVAQHSAHRLTRIVGPRSLSETPLACPGVRGCRNWEELLTDAEVDAVIAGEKGEDIQQAVRQLVAAGKYVLLIPALVQPAAFFYELALIESETPGKLFPLFA